MSKYFCCHQEKQTIKINVIFKRWFSNLSNQADMGTLKGLLPQHGHINMETSKSPLGVTEGTGQHSDPPPSCHAVVTGSSP